jgi:hypothetical protein
MEIKLRGFLVNVHMPSEDLLSWSVDCSSMLPTKYMSLISTLQDRLNEIDSAYSPREDTVKGRSLHGRYRRVLESRTRTLTFSPVPSCYTNKLKSLRAELYRMLATYTVTITQVEMGNYVRKVYILPENMVPAFTTDVMSLDDELGELSVKVNEYLNGKDVAELRELVESSGGSLVRDVQKLHGIEVEFWPVALEEAIDRWASKDPTFAKMLQEQREKLLSRVMEGFKEKLAPVLRAIESQRNLEQARETLERIRNIARSVGLKALEDSVIIPLDKALRDPENTSKYLGKPPEKVEEAVSERIKSVV